MNLFKTIIDVYLSWKSYNRMLSELKSMTDYELRDIGISRGDICRIAANNSI